MGDATSDPLTRPLPTRKSQYCRDHWLSVADEKKPRAALYPLPSPSTGSSVKEFDGTLKGQPFLYRYQSDGGKIEVFPEAPAANLVVKRAIEDMHRCRNENG